MAEENKNWTNLSNLNKLHTNVSAENTGARIAKNLVTTAGSQLGIPQVSAVTNATIGLFGPGDTMYATSPLTQRYTLPYARTSGIVSRPVASSYVSAA